MILAKPYFQTLPKYYLSIARFNKSWAVGA